MEWNLQQIVIEIFCGMPYEPGKSLHHLPRVTRPALHGLANAGMA